MKKLLSFLICIVIITGCESPSDNEITEEQSIIDVNLSVSNPVISLGDSLRFTLQVTNASGEEILFYKDDSEYKYLPVISLEVTPTLSNNTGSGVYNYGYGCWIKEENFVVLIPQQSAALYSNSTKLFDQYSDCFKTAGTYKVSAIVDFENFGLLNWPKDEGEKAKLEEMFNRIPKDSFKSNKIEITVK